MRCLILVLLCISAFYAYSVPGDTLRTFTLDGQPKYGIDGLEYDPDDGNIWAAGNNYGYGELGYCYFCKFKNDATHNIIQKWQEFQGLILVRDIAYPFYYSSQDAIAVLEDGAYIANSGFLHPMPVKMFNKNSGEYLGMLPVYPFDGGFVYGLTVNYDKKTLYATSDVVKYVERWNGSSWEKFADCDTSAMGCAYAWGYIFVVHASPVFQIWVIDATDGTLVDKITLWNWDYYKVWGLSRGRRDVVGKNESLYVACEDTVNYVIREIEVGDYNTGIEITSVGNLKAIFH